MRKTKATRQDVPSNWQDFLGPATLDLLPAIEGQPANPFRVMEETRPEDVRVVLVGRDPYPGKGVPEGLAFSVPPGRPLPASLRNIFQELRDDLGVKASSGSLLPWAKEGVLLWNMALTVRPGEPGSFLQEWRPFSEAVLACFWERPFILLGKAAQEIEAPLRIEAPHPSPLSAWRGFFGSRIFSRTNQMLQELGEKPLSWHL